MVKTISTMQMIQALVFTAYTIRHCSNITQTNSTCLIFLCIYNLPLLQSSIDNLPVISYTISQCKFISQTICQWYPLQLASQKYYHIQFSCATHTNIQFASGAQTIILQNLYNLTVVIFCIDNKPLLHIFPRQFAIAMYFPKTICQ